MSSIEFIQSEWAKDCILDRDQLDVHSLNTPLLHSKYYNMLSQERVKLKHLENEYAELKLRKYHDWIIGPDSKTSQNTNRRQHLRVVKADIQLYFDGDEELVDLSNRMAVQKEKVEFLISVLQVIANRSFSIRNAIEFMKFTAGQ